MGRSRDRINQHRRPEPVAREWPERGETCSVRHSGDRGRGRNIGGASDVRRRRSVSSGSSSRSTGSISSLSKTVSSGSDRGTGGDRRAGIRGDGTVRYSRSRSRERNHGIKARHHGSGVGPRNERDGEKHPPTSNLLQSNGDGSAARFDRSRRCSTYLQDSRGDRRLVRKGADRVEGSSHSGRRGDRNSMIQKRSNSPDRRRGSSLQSGERPSKKSSSDNRSVAREVKPSSSRSRHPPSEGRNTDDKDRRISSRKPQERASSNGDTCRQSYTQGSSSSSQRRSPLSQDRDRGGKDRRGSSVKSREHASPNNGGGNRNCVQRGSASPLPRRSSSSLDRDTRRRDHQKQRSGLRLVRLHRSFASISTNQRYRSMIM